MATMGTMSDPKPRKLYESGGSIVVSLPRDARESIDVEPGDYVLVGADVGKITLSPASIGPAAESEVVEQ